MKFIKPSYEIMQCPDGEEVLRLLEQAARTCYKSEDKITTGTGCAFCGGVGRVDLTLMPDYHAADGSYGCNECGGSGWAVEPSSYAMIRKILISGHHSVIEHLSLTVRFICNRGVTHELVRHRLASYSQESTRYCNYSKDKHGGELNIIEPSYRPRMSSTYGETDPDKIAQIELGDKRRQVWEVVLGHIEAAYLRLIELGEKPQQARDILPIGLKTEIVTSANLREWRHILNLRGVNKRAHPQIRELMVPLLRELAGRIPLIFVDLVEQLDG